MVVDCCRWFWLIDRLIDRSIANDFDFDRQFRSWTEDFPTNKQRFEHFLWPTAIQTLVHYDIVTYSFVYWFNFKWRFDSHLIRLRLTVVIIEMSFLAANLHLQSLQAFVICLSVCFSSIYTYLYIYIYIYT